MEMRFIAKFIVAIVVLVAYASYEFNPYVRGEGAKTECVTAMHLYVMNAIDKEVQHCVVPPYLSIVITFSPCNIIWRRMIFYLYFVIVRCWEICGIYCF